MRRWSYILEDLALILVILILPWFFIEKFKVDISARSILNSRK